MEEQVRLVKVLVISFLIAYAGKKKLEVTVSEKDFMTHCYDLQLWHLLCYIHFQAYYLFSDTDFKSKSTDNLCDTLIF